MFQDPRTGPDSTIPLPVRRLLLWYRRSRRDLPWRGKATPYAVWVSEVMLQQTQVNAVIPYFQSFMARFPTVTDLAWAPLEEVLKIWEGMGYYARARQLHKAAALVVEGMGGHLPQTYSDLITLPGLGPYSAAAIASICFGERVPVMDGNVVRVISRFLAFDADLSRSNARSRIHEYLLGHMPRHSPGDFNQALMELGALLCRPERSNLSNLSPCHELQGP